MRHLVLCCIALVLPLATPIENDQKLGDLISLSHEVSGEVFGVGDHKLKIKNFNYDGQGRFTFTCCRIYKEIKERGMRF